MSRHLDSPTIPQQQSITKHRVYDLERRLNKGATQVQASGCCGETMMFSSDEKWSVEFTDLGTYQSDSIEVTMLDSPYTRARVYGFVNVYDLQLPYLGYVIHFTLWADNGAVAYEFHNGKADAFGSLDGVAVVPISAETMQDFEAGVWTFYFTVQVQGVLAYNCDGGIQTLENIDNAVLDRAQVSVILGQKLEGQELWSWFGPPA